MINSLDPPAEAPNGSSSQIAHTLTACARCRQRKTRCDPQLPRCGPCERANSICEYYDANKGHNVNRNYVVFLQHKVRELERELECIENEDNTEDPEAMMRPVTVRIHDAIESKYLGPASGIAITRLVMQLAKQFTDSKSIKDIVTEQRARQIKELYNQEQAKPTSKVYPLISDVAAVDLPNRQLTNLLVELYKLKVQPLYLALHEPTLDRDIETVYAQPESASAYQNFLFRMVVAISLQKMDTQYAGLADSYYLAALKYIEAVLQPMNLQTLQAFALMAQYSLLTPTRTAIYYIVGFAVRLVQALGYHEEKTITRGRGDSPADCLEIDMRRRLYWCIVGMDFGLAHSLGRPATLATSQEHLDVKWFETCDDRFITPDGVDRSAPPIILKKWCAIHFTEMRLLQLEIRRKLYQKKQAEPQDDSHEWFSQMEAKMIKWRDTAPSGDGGQGLDKVWFIGRYNTMVVFLYRPSPQVPRPSLAAALKCFEACQYNIHMHREQISKKNVDLTWIFTQAIFMAINTMLWSLSYDEVRRRHSRTTVERDLEVAIEAISLASERWPGVASAVQLYQKLILAILKIYEKDGDVPISATTPSSEGLSPNSGLVDGVASNGSQTTSPATVSSASVSTPPALPAPFGYLNYPAHAANGHFTHLNEHAQPAYRTTRTVNGHTQTLDSSSTQRANIPFDPHAPFNPLPEWAPSELTVPSWSSGPPATHAMYAAMNGANGMPSSIYNGYANASFGPSAMAYPFPSDGDLQTASHSYNGAYGSGSFDGGQHWNMDAGVFGSGLTQLQQEELMHSLETDGMEDIQSIITNTLAAFAPKNPTS